jgi:hypothetical protein
MKFPCALLLACVLLRCLAHAAETSPVDSALAEFRTHATNDSYLFVAISPARTRFAARFELLGEGNAVSCRRSVFSDEGLVTHEMLTGEQAERIAKLLREFDWNVRPTNSYAPYLPASHVPASRLVLKHRCDGVSREIESIGDAVPGLVAILGVVSSKQ